MNFKFNRDYSKVTLSPEIPHKLLSETSNKTRALYMSKSIIFMRFGINSCAFMHIRKDQSFFYRKWNLPENWNVITEKSTYFFHLTQMVLVRSIEVNSILRIPFSSHKCNFSCCWLNPIKCTYISNEG